MVYIFVRRDSCPRWEINKIELSWIIVHPVLLQERLIEAISREFSNRAPTQCAIYVREQSRADSYIVDYHAVYFFK